MLIGEPYWIDEPPHAEYEALDLSGGHYVSLDGTLTRFEAAGLRLVVMVLANQDSCDRYEGPQWMGVDDFLHSNPEDPDAPVLKDWINGNRHACLQYGGAISGGVCLCRVFHINSHLDK